jgi:hypothetical protein
MKKVKKFLKYILSFIPDIDPDEYGKRQYRAKRDGYKKYRS